MREKCSLLKRIEANGERKEPLIIQDRKSAMGALRRVGGRGGWEEGQKGENY